MKTIASLVYSGATAKELGMGDIEYEDRKKTVERFILENGVPVDFDAEYLRWLSEKGNNREERNKFPSAPEMAVSGFTALIKSAQSGFATVDDSVREERIAVCRACEYGSVSGKNNEFLRCSLCGCYMNLKAALVNSSCKKGRW